MSNPTPGRRPLLSIITPSHNMLSYLPLCCNSVADQKADCQHIIIDAASTDGTSAWLDNHPNLISLSEEDKGMYDAINKGLGLAQGEIISYLNCDEQYLPGILNRIVEIFSRHPQIDVLFGNTLVIRPDGSLLAYRKSFIPRWPYIWASFLYVQSSSMFIRRRVFESGVRFDKRWRTVGDLDFVIRILRKGWRARHVGEYFSAFMLTGSNLGGGAKALAELEQYRRKAPAWLRYSGFVLRSTMRLEKIFHGAYWEKMPLSYSVYTTGPSKRRQDFIVRSASPFYPRAARRPL